MTLFSFFLPQLACPHTARTPLSVTHRWTPSLWALHSPGHLKQRGFVLLSALTVTAV